MRRIKAPAPQVVPTSRLMNETLVLSFCEVTQSSPVRERFIQCYAKISGVYWLLHGITELTKLKNVGKSKPLYDCCKIDRYWF